MKSSISAAVAVSVLALVGVAYAGSKSGPDGHRGFGAHGFAEVDANHDGKLTREEFQAHQEQLWSEADSNKDGAVTLEEVQQARARRAEKRVTERFQKLDVNHDGRVTQQEAAHMPAKRYARLDVNTDGALTLDEFKAARGMGRHGHGVEHRPDHHERGAAERKAK
jgi:Ca2+-binding EF-hand superfamily protein